MARRPCRRSEPSSSDAEEVSAFDRSRQGSIKKVDKDMGLSPGKKKKHKMAKPGNGTLQQDVDDMLMIYYSTYTYKTKYI